MSEPAEETQIQEELNQTELFQTAATQDAAAAPEEDALIFSWFPHHSFNTTLNPRSLFQFTITFSVLLTYLFKINLRKDYNGLQRHSFYSIFKFLAPGLKEERAKFN